MLQEITSAQGFLKAGFFGGNKSGKTYTATKLMIALKKHFKSKSPIAYFDTENSCHYLAPLIQKETGQSPLAVKSRNFDNLIMFMMECEKKKIEFIIVDSISHVWKNVMESYIKELNETRTRKRLPKRKKLQLQDWGPIKEKWNAGFPDKYINMDAHIIVCGREGDVWDFVEDDDGDTELKKVGVKMKTETEFGYEPSLLVRMQSFQSERNGEWNLSRKATVLGDRFDIMDGMQATFKKNDKYKAIDNDPVWDFFKPHIKMLDGKSATKVDLTNSKFGLDEDGEGVDRKRKIKREILLEKIQAEILRRYPGQTKDDKRGKSRIIETFFGTTSWREIEGLMDVNTLKNGYIQLCEYNKSIKTEVKGEDNR